MLLPERQGKAHAVNVGLLGTETASSGASPGATATVSSRVWRLFAHFYTKVYDHILRQMMTPDAPRWAPLEPTAAPDPSPARRWPHRNAPRHIAA